MESLSKQTALYLRSSFLHDWCLDSLVFNGFLVHLRNWFRLSQEALSPEDPCTQKVVFLDTGVTNVIYTLGILRLKGVCKV